MTLNHIEEQKNPHIFQRVAVGGTFDHIHAGHKILLTMTALLATCSMVVGVTDDIMLIKKKHKELINPINERIQQVQEYLNNVKRGLTYDVVPINDPYGPTITDPTIDALVVSKETLKGGYMGKKEYKHPHTHLDTYSLLP
jgi:pantetheine-phosphate adenylyltransferase